MIEKVAQEIYKSLYPNFSWDKTTQHMKDKQKASAKAAIEAMLEPTSEMVESGCAITCSECHADCEQGPTKHIYQAMLRQALKD